jgi:plastocyanin
MRLTLLTTLVAFGAIACGSEKKPATAQAEAATPATPATTATPAPTPPAPAAEPAGSVVEVKMTGDGTTKAAFEPATLTIKPGTTVRFINVSGGPHNIAFFADSIPKGGAEALKKGMANAMSDLTGPFLTQPNEKYDISFAGAPAGTYKGYCMPHVAFNMKIAIKVQ